jgi:hypothetical protein
MARLAAGGRRRELGRRRQLLFAARETESGEAEGDAE